MENLYKPLSEIARKERKYLIVASAVGLFIVFTGAIPTKISALGIELANSDQKGFLIFYVLVIGYFLSAFLIYGLPEFVRWRLQYQKFLESEVAEQLSWSQEDQEAYDHNEVYFHIKRVVWPYRFEKPSTIMSVGFEFAFPIILAICTIVILLTLEVGA